MTETNVDPSQEQLNKSFDRLAESLTEKPVLGPLRFIGECGELLTAFAEASGEFTEVKKDTKGQIGNQLFMYTTLAGLRAATRPALAKHKIATFQSLTKGMLTFVLAGYGARIESDLDFVPQGDVKEFGRQTTYLRRYQYNAFFELDGVEDADAPHAEQAAGNDYGKRREPPQPAQATQTAKPATQTAKPAARASQGIGKAPAEQTPKPAQNAAQGATSTAGTVATGLMSPKQKDAIKIAFIELKMPGSKCLELLTQVTGKKSSADMTFTDAGRLLVELQSRQAKQPNA